MEPPANFDPVAPAKDLLLEAHLLMQQQNYPKAIKKYQEAAKLAPEDFGLFFNLGFCYHAVGKYTQAIKRYKKAIDVYQANKPQDGVSKLVVKWTAAKTHCPDFSAQQITSARFEILERLVRYRPSTHGSIDYRPIGYDEVRSLLDRLDIKSIPNNETIALFFAGIGDARHAYRTLIHIAECEGKKGSRHRFHLTLVDTQPCHIVRNLIIMVLLQELSDIEKDSMEAKEILSTIFFTYAAIMMPPHAFKRVQEIMVQVKNALQVGRKLLPWLFLLPCDFEAYIAVLENWQSKALDGLARPEVVQKHTAGVQEARGRPRKGMASPIVPQYLLSNPRSEYYLFAQSSLLSPPVEISEKAEPELAKLLQRHARGPQITKAIRTYVEENWLINPTLFDLGQCQNSIPEIGLHLSHQDPFQSNILAALSREDLPTKPEKPSRLYDHIAPFFIDTANAIKSMRDWITIEICLGDSCDIAERLRFGLFHDPAIGAPKGSKSRPKEFPSLFHKLNLSNVPDYVGGHLATSLYFAPILKLLPSTDIELAILHNVIQWDSLEHFLAEFQGITTKRMFEQLTNVKYVESPDGDWSIGFYSIYKVAKPTWFRSFGELLPEKVFRKWFVVLFFRLALPYIQADGPSTFTMVDTKTKAKSSFSTIVPSPLNLTVLFRMVVHMSSIGYPSHWFSEFLKDVLNGDLKTTARPPRNSPAIPIEVMLDHAEINMNVSPFRPEMATLTRIFEPILPFKLATSSGISLAPLIKESIMHISIPIGDIPAKRDIYRYTFHLPGLLNDRRSDDYCVALYFFDMQLFAQLTETVQKVSVLGTLRHLFDPSWGEVDRNYDRSEVHRLRDEGLVIWSTLSWNKQKDEATAWMSSGFIDMAIDKQWEMCLLRTDYWCPLFSEVHKVANVVKQWESWTDKTEDKC